jgi:hypothetical protein
VAIDSKNIPIANALAASEATIRRNSSCSNHADKTPMTNIAPSEEDPPSRSGHPRGLLRLDRCVCFTVFTFIF